MNRRGAMTFAAAGVLTTAVGTRTLGAGAQPATGPGEVKVGCVCNLTGKDLTVYITSGYGVLQAFLKKDACLYYNFYDDKKRRVLSAFAKPNDLVAHFAFVPVANACLLIEADAKEEKTRKEPAAPKDPVTTITV